MNREVLVFIFDGYADWEWAYICPAPREAGTGYMIRTISPNKSPKISMGEFRVICDYSVDHFSSDFHLLLLLGGKVWIERANDLMRLVTEYAVQHQIPVAAICNDANFPAAHGFADHRKHTGNTVEFMKAQTLTMPGSNIFQRHRPSAVPI